MSCRGIVVVLISMAMATGAMSSVNNLFTYKELVQGNCSVYAKSSTNCEQNCGSCFNPGARAGKICRGQQTGYYCPSDSPPAGADMAYACMDWTFGSNALKAAQEDFNSEQKNAHSNNYFSPVYFGVGTYGDSSDPQRGLGACYLIDVSVVDRPLLVQSINTGSDVVGNQFDLMLGDGGAGAYNTCAGSPSSMFPGPYAPSTWGKQYGGADNRSQCGNLPPYPIIDAPMKNAGDNLVTLCEYSFDTNVRGADGENPSIQSVQRVKCPEQLVNLTQIQRTDEPAFYSFNVSTARFANHVCQAGQPGGSLAWCLTRMMDCRKPSGAFKDNIQKSLTVLGRRLVQPCLSDGYTRIDVQCGCSDCYC